MKITKCVALVSLALAGISASGLVQADVPLVKGFAWKDHPLIVGVLREVELALEGEGRVLLRASGTEPLLRVMVEGKDADKVRAAAEKLAGAVRSAVSS